MQKNMKSVQNVDKNPFFSNQQTVAHQPDKFLLDFKGINMQFTPDNMPSVVVNHRVILLDPHQAKEFLNTLKSNIDKYEEQFGKIEKPTALAKAEKEVQQMPKETTTATETPTYMG